MTRNEIIDGLADRGIDSPLDMSDEIPRLSLAEAVAWNAGTATAATEKLIVRFLKGGAR